MIHVAVPRSGTENTDVRGLPFYLALEEWVARTLPPDEYFFAWRVPPTVIFGRNQCADAEVDLGYCRDHGIQVYRRRSGGGCVYADMDNLMLSYVAPSQAVETTFTKYTSMVAQLLRDLGVDAEATGRNDIVAQGGKISGNAFWHCCLPDGSARAIVHGTMLFDIDGETMSRAITPSRSKLASKQVQSVESRVTCLGRVKPSLTIADFERHAVSTLTSGEYLLTDSDIAAVELLTRRYHDPKWTFGAHSRLPSADSRIRRSRRIDGVGEVILAADLVGGRIADIDLTGDFFILTDVDTLLLDRLRGCRPERDDIGAALAGVDTSAIIRGLSTNTFIEYITNQ